MTESQIRSTLSIKTEALTAKGWKGIEEIAPGIDQVLSLDTDTMGMSYSGISMKGTSYLSGKLCHFQHLGMDMLLPENQPVFAWKEDRKTGHRTGSYYPASELPQSCGVVRYGYQWKGNRVNEVVLPATEKKEQYSHKIVAVPEKHIPMKEWLEFFGFWLADGCTRDHIMTSGSRDYTVAIAQNEENLEYVLGLIHSIGFEAKVLRKAPGDRCLNISIFSKQLWTFLHQFGKSADKYVPEEYLELDRDYLECLWKGYTNGDATHTATGLIISSRSKRLIENMQEVVLKVFGIITRMTVLPKTSHGKTTILWKISIPKKKKDILSRFQEFESIDARDVPVYAIALDHGDMMLTRREGTLGWYGAIASSKLLEDFEQFEKAGKMQEKDISAC